MRGEQRRGSIQNPRSGNHREYAGIAAGPSISESHIGTRLLMPGANGTDPVTVLGECVRQAIDLHARQRENGVDVVRDEGLDNGLRTGELSGFHPPYNRTSTDYE